MKYYLFLFTYIFFSCASQGSPNGGPIDDIGPKAISVFPKNNSNLLEDDKIVIIFDEPINPITIVNAIEIFPYNKFSYRVSGKKIILSPKSQWNNSDVLKIKLSRHISDYQNNLMSSPIELFYFNSSKSSTKIIRGQIIDEHNSLFELGLYKIKDSDYKLIEKTESNQKGEFQFQYLNKGKYFVVAVSDSLINIKDDIRKRRYGMITEKFIDLINADTIYTSIRIDDPVERLSIKSFTQLNNSFGNIMYNNGDKTPFIFSKANDKDSLLIELELKNRLESYSINYPITLNNIIDTIPPMIESFEVANNYVEIFINEPIQSLNADNNPIIFYLKDSIYHDLQYNLINPFTIKFPINKEINSKILITNLIDLYNNNNKDTLSLSINSDILLNNDIQGGSVYGSIIYDGENSIIIKAEDINSDAQYFSFANDSNQFSITNIKPGFYTFSAFEFFGGYDSTQYFSGLWEPVSRAAKFSIYPTNLEIRKHWDIKDMIIEIK